MDSKLSPGVAIVFRVVLIAGVLVQLSKTEEHCICQPLHHPVCGTDGTTYPNMCELDCADVGLQQDGPCESISTDGPLTTPINSARGTFNVTKLLYLTLLLKCMYCIL